LALTPLFLHDAQRVVALLCLLSIALRVFVLMQCVVRRHLRQANATLNGISPGQPGRQTAQPTTKRMLGAWRGVTLSRITINGTRLSPLTPLHAVQKRLLVLMEVPLAIYDGLVT
jgi:transposase